MPPATTDTPTMRQQKTKPLLKSQGVQTSGGERKSIAVAALVT